MPRPGLERNHARPADVLSNYDVYNTSDAIQYMSLGLDDRVGPDHLQVEDEPAGLDRVDCVAQDVHDVLRVYSSE